MSIRIACFLLLLLVFAKPVHAQQLGDVDSAFSVARKLAFSSKYPESIALCKQILHKSPNYADVWVLMGRVYFWSEHTDTSLLVLSKLLKHKPYEDGYLAITDIERWTDNNSEALFYVNEGLHYFPQSKDLVLKKAQVIYGIGNYKQAYVLVDSLLKKDKNNDDARVLADKIKRSLYNSSVSMTYDLDHFDKRFANDWHLASIAYSHSTGVLGSVIGRVNYGNRFNTGGTQYEVDMYPSLGKKMYAYVSGGYSPSLPIFPKYRYGISVYRNLPHAFEAEIGIRYLLFDGPVFIYTGSVGKYYKDFWFSLRPTFVPGQYNNDISQSYNLIVRYYTKSANDYFTLTLGYGRSFDYKLIDLSTNASQTLVETTPSAVKGPLLSSYKVRVGYQRMFKYKWIVQVSGGVINEDYTQGSVHNGNDYSVGVGLQRLF